VEKTLKAKEKKVRGIAMIGKKQQVNRNPKRQRKSAKEALLKELL
jgi:hypothetical protein